MSGNDQCIKINTSGDFEIETPSHISTTHAISKPEQKFLKNGRKLSYPQIQRNTLNHFQYSDIRNSSL